MGTNIESKSEISNTVTLQESKEDVEQQEGIQQRGGDQQGQDNTPKLQRFINLPSSINFEVIVQSAWETFALTFQFSLFNGGPASMVYGAILAAFGGSAVALSLAEMASIDPIVGAQYRWTASFAPFAPRALGLLQGWLTVSAWIFSAAATPAILPNFITGLAVLFHPNYNPQTWHKALIMWAFIVIPVVMNLYFRRVLNTLETIGGIIHVTFFIIYIVVLVVLAQRSTVGFVFGTLVTNVSGWTNPVVSFGIGLLTVVYPLAGADGLLHMSAEVKKVRTRSPYSIISSTVSNAVMQFGFVICLMFTIGNLNAVTNTPTGVPLIEVLYLATNSKAGTTILALGPMLICFIAQFNTWASVSRLSWAFARDNGLPFSKTFAKVHPKYKMPLNALGLVSVICFLLSFIYMGSTTAFNAIISLSSIGLHISYILPIGFIMLRKIRGPPVDYGPFKLGKWGIPMNILSLLYLFFVIIWMPFPTELPVTAGNMNYAGPILLAVIIGAVLDWFISGHKRFDFPVPRYLLEDEK